jgi:hypothetical protein
MVGFLCYAYGLWRSFLYIGFYFIFLLPVLMLPTAGAHYLYASSIPFALLFAGLWCKALTLKRTPSLVAQGTLLALLLFAWLRFFQIETFFYAEGSCQRNLIISLNSRIQSERAKGTQLREILIAADIGAKGYVAQKVFFAREKMGEYEGIHFIYRPADISVAPENLLQTKMSTGCLAY